MTSATMPLPQYEVYAIRYAQRAARRHENFMLGDPHDAPMDMDYFVWVVAGAGRTILVDIGFSRETAVRRRRDWLRCPIDSLRLLGLDPAQVGDAVISHLHYDHAGNFKLLPNAQFHIQEPEIQFTVGRHMRNAFFRFPYELDDIVDVLRLNFAERVMFYNGHADIAPGISVEPMPGHTCGLQVVRVHTRRGWIVLIADAAHYFENIRSRRPFAIALDVPQMRDSFDRIMALAGGMDRVIPGHDPLVMKMYPAARPELAGIVARLDVEPDMAVFDAHWAALSR
jgi:glyoxylase-like metal-dependent hydrolase (beta-lactamase superfamily II)